MLRILNTLLAFTILAGCASSLDRDQLQELPISEISSVSLEYVEFSDPRVQTQFQTALEREDPTAIVEWPCDMFGYPIEEPGPSTKFQIVGVTEKFVPLTGERKEIVFHVKLSPFKP